MASGIGHKSEARSTNYLFVIGGKRELTFSVQTSNVSEFTLGTTIFPSRDKQLKIPSDKVESSPLVIDFLVSEDYNEWIEMFKWMMICKNNSASHLNNTESCELIALDAQNQPTVRFVYTDAFPTIVEGIQYAINDDGSNVIVSGATLEYNQFKLVLPNGDVIDEHYSG